jgi:hypothetical protein
MSSNFNRSYIAMSSLTNIRVFVRFFFQPIYTDYANQAYFDKRSHLIFSSETAEPNQTRFGWDSPRVVPFQNCVRQPCPPFSFSFIIKQQWTTKEIFIFSNNSHFEWRSGLSDTILKWD